MQVEVYIPYPHFCPRFQVTALAPSAKTDPKAAANAAASPAAATADWASLEASANCNTAPGLPRRAANQLLSHQMTQLMRAFAVHVSAS